MVYTETGRIQKGMTNSGHMHVVGRLDGNKFIPEHLNGLAKKTPSGHYERDDDTFSVMTTASRPYGRPGATSSTVGSEPGRGPHKKF